MVRRLFIIGFFFSCAVYSKAQNYRILPIYAEVGINAVDVQDASNFITDYFSPSVLNVRSIPISISINTPIFKGLSVVTSVNFNKVSCLICENKKTKVNRVYLASNLNARYSINSIFSKKRWKIDSYTQLGLGLTKIGEKMLPTLQLMLEEESTLKSLKT